MEAVRRRAGLPAGTVGAAAGLVTAALAAWLLTGRAGPAATTELAASWVLVAAVACWATRHRAARQEAAGRTVGATTGLLPLEPVDTVLGDAAAVLVVEADSAFTAGQLLGAGARDELLAETAARLQAAAGAGARVRRLSGPHFVVLVPTADADRLQDLASRLALVGERPASTQAGALTVGIAVAPQDGDDVPALVRAAMVALAHARRESPGSAAFYAPGMAAEARDRFVHGRALRTAIDQRAISLAYQPQLDLASGALVGVEVLARWTDPLHGSVPPSRFVKIADQLGMGRALDRLVFQQAVAQLRAWDDAGLRVPRISVNVSPETLRAGAVPEAVAALLREAGIAPHRVTVELIESRLLDERAGLAALHRLREAGLRVSLDDFGTGYASFSQLVRLPIDELKIDRSFLAAIPEQASSGAVVAAIVRVGQTLGLDVVAEGIERIEQQRLLQALHCPVGQGFLYAPPLTADDLVGWLADRTRLPRVPAARTAYTRPA